MSSHLRMNGSVGNTVLLYSDQIQVSTPYQIVLSYMHCICFTFYFIFLARNNDTSLHNIFCLSYIPVMNLPRAKVTSKNLLLRLPLSGVHDLELQHEHVQ